MVLVPLKCTWIPMLLHVFLNLSPSPWISVTTMEMFLLLLLFDPWLLLLLGWLSVDVCPWWMLFLQLNLSCRVLRIHSGKLQACRAFLVCSVSFVMPVD